MTTSPCRSTKCSAVTTKPSVVVSQGVTHRSAAASVQRIHWVVPPIAPPTTRSPAPARLKGMMRSIAATSETDVPFAYMLP